MMHIFSGTITTQNITTLH